MEIRWSGCRAPQASMSPAQADFSRSTSGISLADGRICKIFRVFLQIAGAGAQEERRPIDSTGAKFYDLRFDLFGIEIVGAGRLSRRELR